MARKVDYEKKMNELKDKIARKEEEVKKLKLELRNVEQMSSSQKNAELLELLEQKNISAADAADIIRRATENQSY